MSAVPIQFQSGATQTPLLELYTSEGCSSCPPAEEWLSRFKDSPKLWKDFVLVAFHVDYWDYLGWKDSFAAKGYSERQRDYAAHWRSETVYTPGFVLDGKEWHGWFDRDELPRSPLRPVGVVTARSEDGKQWSLSFQSAERSASSSFSFYVALLGFDLNSDVKAGENRGRKLQHDFVVLALAKGTSRRDGETFRATLSVSSKAGASTKRLAIAAWVTPLNSMQPLQTVGGWLPLTNRVE
jgi:hypothetical protein